MRPMIGVPKPEYYGSQEAVFRIHGLSNVQQRAFRAAASRAEHTTSNTS